MAEAGAIRAGKAFVELFADDSRLVRTLRQAENRVRAFGAKIQAIGRRLTTLGIAASIPFALSTKTFAGFDDQMRAVKAAVGATEAEFESLTEKAKMLGRTTSFTAQQVAGAMLELGRAGFKPKEIDAAIAAVLDLARATGTDLSLSAEIASNTLRQFELPATEMTRVCDVMVAAANGSATTLEALGESMNYCAPIASEYGLSLEETAKALGSLANYGIKGSQAGTTLRRVLTNLADPSIQKQLKGLGVSVVDQKTGKMREVSAVLRDVGAAVQDMPKDKKLGLFKELFGLYAIAGGAKLTVAQFDSLIEAVDNAGGEARRTAKEMDGGLGGSFRMLWSAVEGVAIAVGEALAPSLQKMTDWLTAATTGLVEYISKNQQLIVYAAKIVTAMIGIGAALFVVGGSLVVVGNIIGIIATSISSVANVAMFGLNTISNGIRAITFVAGSIVSVFSGIASAVGTVFSGIFSSAAVVFGAVTTAVGTAFSIVGTIAAGVFSAIGTAIASAMSPIGLTVIALGAVAGACYLVYRNATAIGNAISTVFSAVVGVIHNAAGAVYSFLNRFTEFKILFGTINIVSSAVRLLGKAFLWLGQNIVAPVVNTIVQSLIWVGRRAITIAGTIISGILTCVGKVVSVAWTVAKSVASAFYNMVGVIAEVVGNILSTVGGAILRVLSPVLNIIGTVIRGVVSVISTLGTVLRTVAGWIISFARSFFVVESVVQVFSLVSNAVRGLIGIFSRVTGAIISTLFSVVQAVPRVVSSIISFFIALPGRILTVFGKIPGIIGGVFSGGVGMVRGVATGISNAFSGVLSFFTSIGTGLVNLFSGIFETLGSIVSGFGNFFLGAFSSIGTAVNWLREQFGSLCSFAVETYGAIVAALGRGDIEAAIGVIWASIKLIWVKGSTSLLSTWYWVVETLQTAWANCVFKISELLTTAWYGVQQIWTDSVYTMQATWIGFMNGIKQAWDYVSTGIAQGIGWIMAKIMGLDPNEMAATITEDYNNRTQQRQDEGRTSIDSLAKERNDKIATIEKEKRGTLDILKQDFENAAGVRNAAYEAKLAAQEQELSQAKAAYDEAINRAKTPPPDESYSPWGMSSRIPNLTEEVQKAVSGFKANTNLEEKVSVTGSFSAAAIANMGVGSVMDRVAKATEQTAKNTDPKRQQEKPQAKQQVKVDAPDEEAKAGKIPSDEIAKEHTRLLRDIRDSAKSGGLTFG